MLSPPPSPRRAKPTLTDGFAEIERTAESAVDDIERMVRVDTTFPPGTGYEAFAGLMEGCVATLGLEYQRIDVPERLWHVAGGPARGVRTNLVARRRSGRPEGALAAAFACLPVTGASFFGIDSSGSLISI